MRITYREAGGNGQDGYEPCGPGPSAWQTREDLRRFLLELLQQGSFALLDFMASKYESHHAISRSDLSFFRSSMQMAKRNGHLDYRRN